MIKRLIKILVFLFASSTFIYAGEEISLFNKDGKAVAYIAVDEGTTIYLWEGEPVAYLESENVYGFNGKHLGWFSRGAIINHDGDGACVLKERYSGYTQYESYKGYKGYKPYKSYKEYAPYKPYESNTFSATPCTLFLSSGI